jgi:hypothetical protein
LLGSLRVAPVEFIAGCGYRRRMCNLYSVIKGQQAIRELFRAMTDITGNMPRASGHLPRLRCPDRPQWSGRPRADDGAVEHAVACFRTGGQKD